jgi:hypothetical protein
MPIELWQVELFYGIVETEGKNVSENKYLMWHDNKFHIMPMVEPEQLTPWSIEVVEGDVAILVNQTSATEFWPFSETNQLSLTLSLLPEAVREKFIKESVMVNVSPASFSSAAEFAKFMNYPAMNCRVSGDKKSEDIFVFPSSLT